MIRLISEFISSQFRKQTISMQMLLDISRNKGNQTIKFGQLIEYKMRNIFLEKWYTMEKLFPAPSLKNQN